MTGLIQSRLQTMTRNQLWAKKVANVSCESIKDPINYFRASRAFSLLISHLALLPHSPASPTKTY
jgi:hypothetical protein